MSDQADPSLHNLTRRSSNSSWAHSSASPMSFDQESITVPMSPTTTGMLRDDVHTTAISGTIALSPDTAQTAPSVTESAATIKDPLSGLLGSKTQHLARSTSEHQPFDTSKTSEACLGTNIPSHASEELMPALSSKIVHDSHVEIPSGKPDTDAETSQAALLSEAEINSKGKTETRFLGPNALHEPAGKDVTVAAVPSSSVTRSDNAKDTAKEIYQIRLVNWYDFTSPKNPRQSPIMVQNRNGPCPLLALVNALVLSTPASLDTPLVETLRTREAVSLGLLLEALIDELMSGRRANTIVGLPDVSELYKFLLALHTGMNVNPRFVPAQNTKGNAGLYRLGEFEETLEVQLYQVFGIPLLHGWLPAPEERVCSIMAARAETYEDVQNVLLAEEDLEANVRDSGLSEEEETFLTDLSSIKYFLASSGTQLTHYGLQSLQALLQPGSIGILFRNDHFSTLYKHSQNGKLLTLVTDMGFARHEEVVWQSLSDVSGEASEFYAGDFRPVGGPSRPAAPHMSDIAALRLDGTNQLHTRPDCAASVVLSQHHHQDHDLALALQLQEEEEERENRAVAARRRENELSQAYLDNADIHGSRRSYPGTVQGNPNGPTIPLRGRPIAIVPNSAPPTYSEAANNPVYYPPVGHPAHMASTTVTRPTVPPRAPATLHIPANSSATGTVLPGDLRNRKKEKSKDCVLM